MATRRSALRYSVMVGAGSLLLIGAALFARPRSPVHPPRPPIVSDLRNLALGLSADCRERGWPELPGSEFVLATIPLGLIDVRNPDNLDILWPGGRVPPGQISRYETIRWKTLGKGIYGDLTPIAGRRTHEAEYRLALGDPDPPVPILGYVDGDTVYLAFSDGRVRGMDRDDLGLAPGAPLVFGEASPSPLLRALSRD